MSKKALATILLLTVIAGSIAWSFYARREPAVDLDIYHALGTVTGEETAKLLGGKGDIVIVTWDSSGQPSPVMDAQISAFAQAIKKQPGMRISATEKMARDAAMMMATGGAAPVDPFLKMVQAHAHAGAMVLFLAFPNLPPAPLKMISESQTKFIVVSGCNPGYKKLLLDRAIDLAIVPRFDRSGENHPPQTARESFDQLYQIVTPEQAVNLPY